MKKKIVVLLSAGATLLLAPAIAGAATLDGAGGTLTYTSAPGQANIVEFLQTGPDQVQVFHRDGDPITASGTCAALSPQLPGIYSCAGIASIVADTGDGDDEMWSHLASTQALLRASAGNDILLGGPSAETLDGGEGDDELNGQEGADTLIGGPGVDRATFHVHASPAPDVSITLDDQANDGPAGRAANVHSDVEDVLGESYDANAPEQPGTVTIVGSDGPNRLTGAGRVAITGGAGNDVLTGDRLDDTFDAHDGAADSVTCGGGTDTAIVDLIDTVAGDCENVEVVPRVAPVSVVLAVTQKRGSRFTVSGKVRLAATVTQSRGCGAGVVAIAVKGGRKPIFVRRASLRSNCSFKRRLTVRATKRRVLRFTARFGGNTVMAAKASKSVRARIAG